MEQIQEKGNGLWANIHAKRERIKRGSGERMRKPGEKGAPTAADFKASQKNEETEVKDSDDYKLSKDGKKVKARRIVFKHGEDDGKKGVTEQMKKTFDQFVQDHTVELTEEEIEDALTCDLMEVLKKSDPAGKWISDFVKSDNPKFAGKSKEKRKQMALAAYYAKQRNEEAEIEEGNNTQKKFTVVHYSPKTDRNVTKKIKANSESEVWDRLKAKGINPVSVKEDHVAEGYGVGWMLRADPKLGAKVKAKIDAAKLRQKYMGKTSDEIEKMRKEKAKQTNEALRLSPEAGKKLSAAVASAAKGGKVHFQSTSVGKDGKKTTEHGYTDSEGNRVVTKVVKEEEQMKYMAEAVDHQKMADQHAHHSERHELEASNDGHPDHDYASTAHANAEAAHKEAAKKLKQHGADSEHYKKAAAEAATATRDAKDESSHLKFRKVAKPHPISEQLKGNQHKIDKNKNGKVDAHDFKLLRKEETDEIDEAQSHQAKTTMKHIKKPTAGEKKAAADIKPGVAGFRDRIAMLKSAEARGALKKEETEQVDEAWPGTAEYKKKFPDTERTTGRGERHDIEKTATGVKATRRYSTDDTTEKPASAPKRGRGRPKKDKFAEAVNFLMAADEQQFEELIAEGFDAFFEAYERAVTK